MTGMRGGGGGGCGAAAAAERSARGGTAHDWKGRGGRDLAEIKKSVGSVASMNGGAILASTPHLAPTWTRP